MQVEYLPIAILVLVATIMAFAIVGLGHLIGPKRSSTRKLEPYESGMRPIGPGRRQVQVHFYLVAVLFILFDIEIVFLLPWAVSLRQLGLFGIIEMAIFIVILLVGYVYAWRRGALEWE
ncbi:MAG TPA: NADH-quinone oxidoreductase subunit A [Anaerolineales bacterium]|jgi:NADH-quinone oxidoreductase subunit A